MKIFVVGVKQKPIVIGEFIAARDFFWLPCSAKKIFSRRRRGAYLRNPLALTSMMSRAKPTEKSMRILMS
jgi:hypothetical protein